MSLRIIFMGTPEFAVASLEALHKSQHKVVAVVTMPDKPAGRGQKIRFSDVKQYALDNNLPLLQPEKLKDDSFIEALRSLNADLFVVVAFRMLPEVVWSMPPKGTINLHGSLLPQYRGAAPINHAIMDGAAETGVTTFFIEKEIDTGKVLFYEKTNILPTDNAGSVHDRLMNIGAGLIVKTVDAIASGNALGINQHEMAPGEMLRQAPKLTKESCRINWSRPALEIHNQIRGLSPCPAAWTTLKNSNGQALNVKIFESAIGNNKNNNSAGAIDSDGKKLLKVFTPDGTIEILQLQVEGKKRLSTEEFLRGFNGIENWFFE